MNNRGEVIGVASALLTKDTPEKARVATGFVPIKYAVALLKKHHLDYKRISE